MGAELKVFFDTDINRLSWDAFVKTHPRGNVFQSPEMFEVFRDTKSNHPLAIAITLKDEIQGLLLADIITKGRVIIKNLTARSIIIGGPLALNNDPVIIQRLMAEYKRALPRYVVYSEIRPIFDMQDIASSLVKSGFKRKGHLNLWMELGPDESCLWNQMHKERRRNVRKAQATGLQFKEVNDNEGISQVVSLIDKTYHRKKVPQSFNDMFYIAKDHLNDRVRFFAAYYNNQMIAGQIRLFYKKLAYAWFAGSDDSYFKLYPNDFLMWNVICWSFQNGYEVFDFGGGGEPGVPYGVRDYKLKFGCQMDDYGRFVIYHKPTIYRLAKGMIRILGMKKG